MSGQKHPCACGCGALLGPKAGPYLTGHNAEYPMVHVALPAAMVKRIDHLSIDHTNGNRSRSVELLLTRVLDAIDRGEVTL